ncbi:MAG: hypothetical protein M3403_04845 [Gemmatimonadota bacterium]|nr:hypothetical protein [Gemmatimonadota bacterium]
MFSDLSRTGLLYYVAGALAMVAALAVVLSGGFLAGEYTRAGLYAFWSMVMFALGYRARQKAR